MDKIRQWSYFTPRLFRNRTAVKKGMIVDIFCAIWYCSCSEFSFDLCYTLTLILVCVGFSVHRRVSTCLVEDGSSVRMT